MLAVWLNFVIMSAGRFQNKVKKIIYLGADHAGFEYKEKLKKYLSYLGYSYKDFGAYYFNPKDDYPDFGLKVAKQIAKQSNALGILLCGTGIGMCIIANRIKRVRAALCWNEEVARRSKEEDKANILCLGARILSWEKIKKIVKIWLEADFKPLARYQRRIKKLDL